jgi:tetratricopeptide (TPR) repeat protein
LTKDTFFGYFKEAGKDQLVAGGRYRPFSLVMFALEYELFGANPVIGHLVNVLLYGLLGIVLYLFLTALFRHVIAPERLVLFSLVITLVYTFHPIHTEAVANIKGRDEILAMLLSLLSWLILLKTDKKWFHLILAGGLFFLAMLSKENPITLAPLIGLGYWMLGHGNIKKSILVSIPIFAAISLYLVIRFSILGNTLSSEPLEMMNNPFVKFENGQYAFFTQSERYATILASMGEYLRLLVFPHPLTNDYYPRQVGVMHWSDLKVIGSLLMYLVLGGVAAISILKRKAIGFGVIFYLVTISIFSNVLFPIGTHLSERFLFMPSLGYAMVIGFLFNYLYYKKISYVLPIFVFVLGLFGLKTISRNMVWKDNYTLFTTDVKTSLNSAKALNAAAGSLADATKTTENEPKKQKMLSLAKEYLQKALEIHPNYKNAWLILANVHYYSGDGQKAIDTYDALLSLDGNYQEAINNKALVLRYLGREAGEEEQNLPKALRLFKESYKLNAQDWETIRLLGLSEGMMGNHENAIKYFQKFVQMLPNEVAGYVLLSQAFQNQGDLEQAQLNRQKALSMDPKAFDK